MELRKSNQIIMGMELIGDREVSLAENRKRATEALQAFPEAAALSADELAAAVDRVVAECNPETATPAAPGMVRLTDNQIKLYVGGFLKMPDVDDELPADGVFPPGWLQARRRQLAQRMADGVLGVSLVAKIRVDLLTRGYVEAPERPEEDPDDVEYNDEWWLEEPADPSMVAHIWLPNRFT